MTSKLGDYYREQGESDHLALIEAAIGEEWATSRQIAERAGKSKSYAHQALHYLAEEGRAEALLTRLEARRRRCWVWRRPQAQATNPTGTRHETRHGFPQPDNTTRGLKNTPMSGSARQEHDTNPTRQGTRQRSATPPRQRALRAPLTTATRGRGDGVARASERDYAPGLFMALYSMPGGSA